MKHLTYKLSLSMDGLVGFQYKLALRVWRETLVQEQDPRAVCGTQQIPPYSSSKSSTIAATVSNVAHLNAEGKLVA